MWYPNINIGKIGIFEKSNSFLTELNQQFKFWEPNKDAAEHSGSGPAEAPPGLNSLYFQSTVIFIELNCQ